MGVRWSGRQSPAARVRFLTGRCIVSKTKSDKASPDLDTPTDLPQDAVDKISASLNALLADAFALYLKPRISTGTSAAGIFAIII